MSGRRLWCCMRHPDRNSMTTKNDLEILKRDMKIWFGTVMVIAVGVILAAIRYLPPHS